MTAHRTPRPPLTEATLISIVLPVYNEADVLRELLGRLGRAMAVCRCSYEIIFVDDGSNDGSSRILDELAAADYHVHVVHFSRNFGHQAAVQAGLAHSRGDAVVLMDSDLQDDPDTIPRFVQQWLAGNDVVYAVRTLRKEAIWKRFLFAAFHRLMSRVASVPVPTDAGIFGLVDRRIVRRILALGETDRYFPGLRSWVGYRQTGIIVERHARYDRTPRVSLTGLIRLAKTALFSFSTAPLMIFHVIGVSATALFLGLAGYSLYCKLFTSYAIPGWTSYILTGSFFGALNALGISILGEYVIRIYDQVRNRPLYLVDRTVNVPRDESLPQFDDRVGDTPYEDLVQQAEYLLEAGTIPEHSDCSSESDDEFAEPITLPIREP